MSDYEYWDAQTGEPLSDCELYELYDDMLNEVYESTHIGYTEFMPSDILRSLDPVAYRCGFNDWLDSELWNGVITDDEPTDE